MERGFLVLAFSLVLAAPAHAVVTAGGQTGLPSTGAATGCGAPPCTFIVQDDPTSPALTYKAPVGGVIVRWRIVTGTQSQIALHLVKQVDPTHWTGIRTSEIRDVAPDAERIFPTRLRVSIGDLIGFDQVNNVASIKGRISNGGTRSFNPILLDGDPAGKTNNGAGGGFAPQYNADIEPDADADGYGDETQDPCSLDASKQQGCTRITNGPKNKVRIRGKKSKVKFAFTVGAPKAQCRLDRGGFKPCVSPFRAKVKTGRHTFAVRGVSSTGVADSAPDSDRWKVKKKKHGKRN